MRSSTVNVIRRLNHTSEKFFVFLLFTQICLGSVIRSNSDQTNQERRNKIRDMTLHAWKSYEKYAWGTNELRPISKAPNYSGVFGSNDIGATIVDSLSTLYIMGLNEEYQKGRDWVEEHFSFKNVNADLSVFETNIRFVGGMLSMYALTGDELFKVKAQEVADKLLSAFETPTGIPRSLVNIQTGFSSNYGWASGSVLAEIGTLHLEFIYLSDITGNTVYRDRVMTVRQVLNDAKKLNGLYPNYIDPSSGAWGQPRAFGLATNESFNWTHTRSLSRLTPKNAIPQSFHIQIACRKYSTNDDHRSPSKQLLPTLMEFPKTVWPSLLKTIKNWILVNFIVRPYFDQEFKMPDFVMGTKQALQVVLNALASGEIESLNGLVSTEALNEIKQNMSTMSMSQRNNLAVSKDDIYFSFPYQVGIIFDESNASVQKRFVEITMVFHVLHGLREMQENGTPPPLNVGVLPEYRDKISICNYRFIKQFTKGFESDWTINVANHFKPSDMINE